MEYVYPAVFSSNHDGSFTITFPDLCGCVSEGKSLEEAMCMAASALAEWVDYFLDNGMDIPPPSPASAFPVENGRLIVPIRVETGKHSTVRRMVAIPRWMDEKAAGSGLCLSQVLQDALNDIFTC